MGMESREAGRRISPGYPAKRDIWDLLAYHKVVKESEQPTHHNPPRPLDRNNKETEEKATTTQRVVPDLLKKKIKGETSGIKFLVLKTTWPLQTSAMMVTMIY